MRGKVPHTLSRLIHPLPGCHRGEDNLLYFLCSFQYSLWHHTGAETGDLDAVQPSSMQNNCMEKR